MVLFRRRGLLGTAIAAISMACGSTAPPEAGPPPGSGSPRTPTPVEPATPTKCEPLPFAETAPVPEASGAAWMEIDGALALVVVGDSGNDGAYVVLDPETGATREQGKLPIGSGSDDLEGLAIWNGRMVAVSSSGWIREWKRVERGFELVAGPYPLGPVDLPDKGQVDRDAPGMVCSERKTNCGRDYEGICLAPPKLLVAPPKPDVSPKQLDDSPSITPRDAGQVSPRKLGDQVSPCLGFVAAKADGTLYCVLERDGKLAVDRALAIPITGGGRIADCAISDDGVLVVGSNLFGNSNVYRVAGWTEIAKARVDEIGSLGIGFPETIAIRSAVTGGIRGEVIYRMSDTGGAPSTMTKYWCR